MVSICRRETHNKTNCKSHFSLKRVVFILLTNELIIVDDETGNNWIKTAGTIGAPSAHMAFLAVLAEKESRMSAVAPNTNLTSGRLLARNTVWNLLGTLLPMAVAVVSIPPLVRALGLDRFGLLSLAWVVIGYFSLLDVGIGRALTKLVAEKLGTNEEQSVPPLAWTSLLLLFVLGVLGGLVTLAVSGLLVHEMLKIPATLQSEALSSFHLLALSIPTVTVTSGLRGILEAQQRFRLLNLIRIPMSIFSFAGLLLALPFSHSLVPVITILVVGRVLGLLAHFFACLHTMPLLRHSFLGRRREGSPCSRREATCVRQSERGNDLVEFSGLRLGLLDRSVRLLDQGRIVLGHFIHRADGTFHFVQ